MSLSDEEFNELLRKRLQNTNGDPEIDEKSEAELLSEEEEADLAIMRDALSSYKAESLAWAEQWSAAMPPPRPNAVVSLWDRAPRWALAGVAVSACAVAALTFTHTATPAATRVALAPTAQVLAADNQLLSSVDDALTRGSSTPSAQELGLSATDLLIDANSTQRHGATGSATD